MTSRVESRAYARAGLLGNPSDGYGGRTISFAFDKFFARVLLSESNKIVIQQGENDRLEFESPQELSDHIEKCGFYGGVRLIKSAIKRICDYCGTIGTPIDRNFSIRYSTNIPRQVGLAGSSAIVIATIRGICQFNKVAISPDTLAMLALESETALGIAAGPQDRVIQSYEGLMYMEFAKKSQIENGQFLRLSIPDNHNFYIAFSSAASEPTEVLHGNLRSKMASQDDDTITAMNDIAGLASQGKVAIESGDHELLNELIDKNFDLRQRVCQLNPSHVKMIETARNVGASAKYCGSGGAIVGQYRDLKMFELLKDQLESIGCTVFRPTIVQSESD